MQGIPALTAKAANAIKACNTHERAYKIEYTVQKRCTYHDWDSDSLEWAYGRLGLERERRRMQGEGRCSWTSGIPAPAGALRRLYLCPFFIAVQARRPGRLVATDGGQKGPRGLLLGLEGRGRPLGAAAAGARGLAR